MHMRLVQLIAKYSRTADLGLFVDTAICYEGPVWGSGTAATLYLGKVGSGPKTGSRVQGLLQAT